LPIHSRSTLLLVFAGLVGCVFAQDHASSGKVAFGSHCAVCHGIDGKGNTTMGKQLNAADLNSEAVQKMSNDEMTKVVSGGKGSMPAFADQLSSDEIADVVRYLHTFGKKK
jgi:mono/diheme cytochrome c family protein